MEACSCWNRWVSPQGVYATQYLLPLLPSLCTSCHFNRLHPTCKPRCTVKYSILSDISKRVVGLRDQQNKTAHAQSTKLACEVAGAICTVSSLTREDNCLRYYSNSLDEALKRSNKMALWSNLIFSFSQSSFYWSVALVFWYGSTLVSRLEITITAFFTTFLVRVHSRSD